jgi:hypothetical protein
MSNTIDDMKNFNWQKIIDYGNGLGDLNDAQLRFVKGRAVELAIETQCIRGSQESVQCQNV